MRSSSRLAVAALVVAALLPACSSSSAKPTTASTPKTSVPTTTRAPSAPASSAALEARIVTKIPSRFKVQPDAAYDTGPSDLAKAIRDDGAKDAEKVLRAEKFVQGYQRLWLASDQTQIIVFIYQFATSTGARQDYTRGTAGYDAKAPPGTHKFAVPQLPAGSAVGLGGSDAKGTAALVFFTTGAFNVEINCNGSTTGSKVATLQALATSIANDQFTRLTP